MPLLPKDRYACTRLDNPGYPESWTLRLSIHWSASTIHSVMMRTFTNFRTFLSDHLTLVCQINKSATLRNEVETGIIFFHHQCTLYLVQIQVLISQF